MILYVLNSSQFSKIFGTPEDHTPPTDVWAIAQYNDLLVSSYLVLADNPYPEFTPFVTYDNYIYTYCQEWGLVVTDALVERTKIDIESKKT